MHRPTPVLLNFLYLGLGHAFYKVTALVTLVLLARWLGSVEFGRLVVAMAAAQLAMYLLDLGVDQALVREGAGRTTRLRSELGSALPLRVGLATLGIALSMFLVLAATGEPALAEVALYIGLSHGLSALTGTLRATFQAFERMEYEAMSVALEGWVRLGAVLFAIAARFGLLGIAKALALASFIVFAATLLLVIHRFTRPALSWSAARMSRLAAIGLPFAAVWLFAVADHRLNSLVLARVWSDADVGIFGAAIRLIEPALIVPSVLVAAFFPVAVRHDRAGRGTFSFILVSTQKALLVMSLPMFLILAMAADGIVHLVFGAQFAESAGVVRILAPALVLLFMRIGLAQALLAVGRWREALFAQAIGLGVDIVLAFALIPGLAASGAAAAVLAGQASAVMASVYALREHVDRSLLTEVARPLLVAVGAGLLGQLALLTFPSIAVLGAMAAYALGLRFVRVFSSRDVAYVRSTAPTLAVAVALAADDRP